MTGDWDPDAQPIQVHGDAPSQPTYLQSRSEPAQFIPRRCVGRKQYICKEIHLRCQPRISEVFAVSTGTLPLNDNASRRFRQRTLVVMLTYAATRLRSIARPLLRRSEKDESALIISTSLLIKCHLLRFTLGGGTYQNKDADNSYIFTNTGLYS